MNVTFLIGNGFDLRLGLHTKYTDMYEGYIKEPSGNEVIRRFKKTLEQDSPNGYKTWGDFEMAMAQHAKTFSSEEELIVCVRDFKEYMANHLQSEQQKFMDLMNQASSAAIAKEMNRATVTFYKGQTPNVINEIEEVYDATDISCNYIVFNYTTLLDEILKKHNNYYKISKNNQPVHIHGQFSTDIVLGIDNISQAKDLPYLLSKKGERAFIKTAFNVSFDKRRVEIAEQLIDESDVICVYGMSLGESDRIWISHLYNWLISDINHHLIYFKHSHKKFSRWKRDEMMDEEDAQKQILLRRLCTMDEMGSLEQQVHIPIDYDIFDFVNRIKTDIDNRPHFVGAPGIFTAPK